MNGKTEVATANGPVEAEERDEYKNGFELMTVRYFRIITSIRVQFYVINMYVRSRENTLFR